LLLLAVCWLILIPQARAFPPAPYYTLYGLVRDQVGQTITAEGAEIILLKDGVEVGRTPITPGLQLEQNYELTIRLDQVRAGTTLYSQKAVAAGGQFSLVVLMNYTLFYPIEVSGTLTAGGGAERNRLDLTLGSDEDGDGLPDSWESWQLYQAGLFADGDGNWDLSLIDALGDLDGDGQSNGFEYIAGTFAGDATEIFSLAIKEKSAGSVRLEFYAITNKAYTIERSADMQTWSRLSFATTPSGRSATSFIASEVGLVSAYATPASEAKEFYRLTVR
jgi:hypothetical protein